MNNNDEEVNSEEAIMNNNDADMNSEVEVDPLIGDYGRSNEYETVSKAGESMKSCLDPGWYSFIIGIIIQFLFIIIYSFIYHYFFRKKKSVTKLHMFVFYFNSSFWGWAVYLLFYKVICGGSNDTNIFITACVFLGIFGFFSCTEICSSREGGYFRHQNNMKDCIKYMNKMKTTAPIHRVEIECYHYVYTDHDRFRYGRTIPKGKVIINPIDKRKVITHKERRDFVYDRWTDSSDYPNLPEISFETPILAIDSTISVAPGDDFTQKQFESFRIKFVEENQFRDIYVDVIVRPLVPGHQATVTAKSEKDNEVPWWLNSKLFYCLAFLFCSCPLRVLFRSKSRNHKFQIKKAYYLDPEGPNIDNAGGNITVHIMDIKDLVTAANCEGMPLDYSSADVKQYPPPPEVTCTIIEEKPPKYEAAIKF